MAKKKTRAKEAKRTAAAAATRRVKKKICQFCKDKSTYVDYKDVALLRRYLSDRGKIKARRVNGNCPIHQRDVATAVKNAREMVLLPYKTLGASPQNGGRGRRRSED